LADLQNKIQGIFQTLPLAVIQKHQHSNMKISYIFTLSIVFSIWTQDSIAQSLRLIVKNPLPRINQEIQFGYFYTNSNTSNRYEASIDNGGVNNLITGDINILDSTNTTSQITLGPIELKYNGKNIKSDSLTIKVFEALPDTNQGIWINQVYIEENLFIIIEQRVPLSLGRTKYASFNRAEFLKFNIDAYEYSTQTSSFQVSGNRIEKNEYRERRTILLIRNLENLKSDLTIKDSFFKDLPKNCEPIKLVVKKE